MEDGMDGLLDLSLQYCGLTVKRIRKLHEMRFSIINSITDTLDKGVGQQGYSNPNF